MDINRNIGNNPIEECGWMNYRVLSSLNDDENKEKVLLILFFTSLFNLS